MGIPNSAKFALSVKLALLIGIVLLVFFACSKDLPSGQHKTDVREGFTFFELGSNSLLTNQVRNNLERRLGSEAIERRATIDLTIHTSNFLKKYFPHLDEINRRLNWPPRERVEHNITKLIYRYASSNKIPFLYVELFFSDYTGRPIFFRMVSDSRGAAMVDVLKKKYGQPQKINWSNEDNVTFFWQKQKDVMTASVTKDLHGKPEYLFCIFHVENLENLIETEKLKKKAKEEKIQNAGRSAF